MMQYTPVIPPAPGSQATSPRHAPVVPQFSPNNPPSMPPWSSPHQFPVHSPYTGPMMTSPPGSYFIPPAALPQQASTPSVAPVGGGGFSADWTGFPTSASAAGSPYVQATSPGTQAQAFSTPGTAYNAFQQPLPPGYGAPPPGMPPGMHPGMMHPAMWSMMGMMPMGGYTPLAVPAGWPGTPFPVPGAGGLPPQAVPAAPPQNTAPQPQPRVPPMYANQFDKVDRFAEGPHYGPVLTPAMVKKVRARPELNPLLMPPPEEGDHEYIKWNMLFSTAQCQRSCDPAHRSWSNGRNAPATWPRITSLRLVSRAIPTPIEVSASNMDAGVTCGDVIEAICTYMNGRLSQRQYDTALDAQKRVLSEAYYHNRSTAHGVPGGRLPQTLLRFDWLGQDTMYGGCVVSEQSVRELCGVPLPCVFELKTMRRYPMSEQEIEEHERREAESESRHSRSRRRRSRATSRATSATTSRVASEQPDTDDME